MSCSTTWDARVRDVLGEEFHFWDGVRTCRVTLRDLAAHTLGLRPHDFVRLQGPTREQIVQCVQLFGWTRVSCGKKTTQK